MTAARITEAAVGASTCASGSQVWNGNIGTLTAKAIEKAAKTSALEDVAVRAQAPALLQLENVERAHAGLVGVRLIGRDDTDQHQQ